MAIAEVRVGILPRVQEKTPSPIKLELSPIKQFSTEDLLDYARNYPFNLETVKKIDPTKNHQLEAWISGTLEVQKIVLRMLGQSRLLGQNKFGIREVGFDPVLSNLEDVREVTPKDIEILSEMYRKANREFAGVPKKKWNETSPSEEKTRGNIEELERALVKFGQTNLVRTIDMEFNPPINNIDWAKMRSSGHGEIL